METFWIGVGAFFAIIVLLVWVGASFTHQNPRPEGWERNNRGNGGGIMPFDDDGK